MFRERTRLACWFRRRAETIFPSTEVRRGGFREKSAIARTRSPARETRALPKLYFANSYRYSTNDIVAPSKSWIFGFVDSMM